MVAGSLLTAGRPGLTPVAEQQPAQGAGLMGGAPTEISIAPAEIGSVS
jgi:hypothetical protein